MTAETVEPNLSTAAAPDPARQPRRFRNWSLAFAWLLACVAASEIGYWRYPGLVAFIAAAFALYAAHAAAVTFQGIIVSAISISVPRPVVSWLPILVLGRITIPAAALLDVTARGDVFGFECASLATVDGQHPVLFSNRAMRLAFFEALKARQPEVRIYRMV